MKKILIILLTLISIIFTIIIVRSFFIDYVIVSNDKFSPSIEKGDIKIVCKICNNFKAGDYVLVDSSDTVNYKLMKIDSFIDSETMHVIDGQSVIDIKIENVHGKLF